MVKGGSYSATKGDRCGTSRDEAGLGAHLVNLSHFLACSKVGAGKVINSFVTDYLFRETC